MSDDYRQDVEVAINAGIDMVMVPLHYRDFVADLKALVAEKRVPTARIDDAVRRILRQKARFKLWERPFTDRALTAQIGSPEHRAVARQAVQQSLVVLKNDRGVLPLSASARVHLCGFRADDVGVQCGGWSVGWRGGRGATTPGTTIRQGFEQVLGVGRVTFLEDAAGAESADVVVAVVGEVIPTPRGSGDTDQPRPRARTAQAVAAAAGSGKPLVGGAAGAAADPRRSRRRRGRVGGRLAAGNGGRRDRRRARRRRQANRQAPLQLAAGHARCRFRSTSATGRTRHSTRTGSVSAGEGAPSTSCDGAWARS